MSKVRKWDGEGTFAETRGNDGVAPQPVIVRDGPQPTVTLIIQSTFISRTLQGGPGPMIKSRRRFCKLPAGMVARELDVRTIIAQAKAKPFRLTDGGARDLVQFRALSRRLRAVRGEGEMDMWEPRRI